MRPPHDLPPLPPGEGRGEGADLPTEFARIAQYFRPLAGEGALALNDDAAVFTLPPGRELVIAADAMVEGVHFLSTDPPDLIARKLLRTNLSDLAAMGAAPLAYLLTVSVQRGTDESWFAGFSAGLATDQAEFGLHLLGGDTTSTPGPISLSLTILGTVAPGTALRRNGAQAGDDIWVSGTIGDGALGLLAAQGELPDPDGFLSDRYHLPQPRVPLGLALVGIAHAAMDVSDGLVQDLSHICRASGLAAELRAADVPLSQAARTANRLELCLTGGDDYELLFAAPRAANEAILAVSRATGIAVTRIGTFRAGPPHVTTIGRDGNALSLGSGGWSHL